MSDVDLVAETPCVLRSDAVTTHPRGGLPSMPSLLAYSDRSCRFFCGETLLDIWLAAVELSSGQAGGDSVEVGWPKLFCVQVECPCHHCSSTLVGVGAC